MPNSVEQLKSEYDEIAKYLQEQKQPSLESDLNKHLRKVLLLSAGSYFEYQVTQILLDFVREKSNNDNRIVHFLQKQAINQKYHTLFDWGTKDNPNQPTKNANAFWKLFGDEFKQSIDAELKENPDDAEDVIEEKKKKADSIKSFVEIGHLRNILVHSNFADYNYDQKTTDEIFLLFQRAEPFLEYLKKWLK